MDQMGNSNKQSKESQNIDDIVNRLLNDAALSAQNKKDVVALANHISKQNELKRKRFEWLKAEAEAGDKHLLEMLEQQRK